MTACNMLRVAAATAAPSAKAAKRIRPRARGAVDVCGWLAPPANGSSSSRATSISNVPATGSGYSRHLSHAVSQVERIQAPREYPCVRCMSTTADVEGLLSTTSSSSSGSRTSNVRSSNNNEKGRSSKGSNNRPRDHQHRLASSKGGRNQQQQKERRKHKAKGVASKRPVHASDAIAAAAVAARALPDKAALLLPRATERMGAFLRSRALLPLRHRPGCTLLMACT